VSRPLAGCCIAFALLSAIGLGAQRPAAADAAAIRLKTATFRPAAGEAPELPPGLVVAAYAEGQRGYYLVQFSGPVDAAWKAAVEAEGAELLEYVPDFAFKVRMSPGEAARVDALADVAWVGLFHPAYKLPAALPTAGRALYRVRIERGANQAAAAAQVAASGAQVLSRQGAELLVAADAAQLEAVARVLDVATVRPHLLRVRHNESASQTIGAAVANTRGFDGAGEMVAVADTGLGAGSAASAHPGIAAGRVAGVFNWRGVDDSCWAITDDGAVDVDSGHGTHTAVSAVGAGTATGLGRGTAPGASLVFQSIENWATMKGLCALFYPSGYYLTGLPANLGDLFQQAYAAGARVHSNSWGSAAAGDYTLDSVQADAFVRAHPDMTVTFSAGNEGIDANADGAVDNDSMGAPATAKNVITVGASEVARTGGYPCDPSLAHTACAAQGGTNTIFTWGTAWPSDYPAGPLKDDASAGNAQQMAAFSSRGPTDDNRIKPDVVAPGTWILSGFSGLYQQGYDAAANPRNGAFQYDGWGFPLTDAYKYMGGTSMSNPLVAGGAAVLRQYFKSRGAASPSSALVKAALVNTAVDMLDENNDGQDDNDFPIPNTHEGWGLVDLDAATDGRVAFADSATGLATGGVRTFTSSAAGDGAPLKITLVWSDYESTEAAAVNLVNDLDLEVTAPGGVVYRGNVLAGGWSGAGGTADRRNNVENVYLQAPLIGGPYTVTVRGFNVPQGPQPFALVVSGGTLEAVATPPPPTVHLAGLTGTGVVIKGSSWQARVTATVRTGTTALAGAPVSGTWSGGASGSGSCTTTSTGSCVVSSATLNAKKASATFTVTGIAATGYTYTPSANTAPSSVTVAKP
jgi:serine protease AprX